MKIGDKSKMFQQLFKAMILLSLLSCQAVLGGAERDLSLPCDAVGDCDDGNACTIEQCLEGRCQYNTVAEPEIDSDGDGLTCVEGDCDDSDPDVHPGAEDVCDGKNNDCDEEIDEDAAGVGSMCTAEGDGRCSEGTRQCFHGVMTCVPEFEPTTETCNGLDDDCDGVCDEGFACCVGDTRPCEFSTGGCVQIGVELCSEGCNWSGHCAPPPEECNGEDDDCDGEVDEDFDCTLGEEGTCTTECGSEGRQICMPGCTWWCQAQGEVCNGSDDDCDEECDEGWDCCAGEVESCTTWCGTTGSRTCTASCELPDECELPEETCNGVDDDCDGHADESEVVRVSDPLRPPSHRPSIVWTGSEYGIAWEEHGAGVRFARVSFDGVVLPHEITASDSACDYAWGPSLAWNGSEYGLAYTCSTEDIDDSNIYFSRISETGVPAGESTRVNAVGGNAGSPNLVWSDREYGVVWRDHRRGMYSELYFARLDSTGVRIGEDNALSAERAGEPSIVWTGTEYGVAWSMQEGTDEDLREHVQFTRVSEAGLRIGDHVRVSDLSVCGRISATQTLSWTGTEYGIAWIGMEDSHTSVSQVFFARISSIGVPTGIIQRVNDFEDSGEEMHGPTLAWDGDEYGLVWESRESEDSDESILDFARISESGTVTGGVSSVTREEGVSGNASILRIGTGFSITWAGEYGDRHRHIYVIPRLICL